MAGEESLMDYAAADAQESGDTSQAAAPNNESQGAPGDSPDAPVSSSGERPDYLPEKFWDPEAGTPRLEELAKSQKDFETKYRNRDGTKAESVEDYQFTVPEGAEYLLMQGEDGQEDPLVAGFKEHALKSGMSQEMFKGAVEWYLQFGKEMMPAFDPQAEIEAMGPQGPAKVGMLSSKTRQLIDHGVLTDDEAETFKMMWNSADTANVLHKVLNSMGEQPIPSGDGQGTGPVSESELDMMYQATYEDGPYKGQRKYAVDSAYRAKVDKMYERRYGKDPGRTSRQIGA